MSSTLNNSPAFVAEVETYMQQFAGTFGYEAVKNWHLDISHFYPICQTIAAYKLIAESVVFSSGCGSAGDMAVCLELGAKQCEPKRPSWTLERSPPVTLSSTTAVSLTFTAPAVVTQTIPLTFTLVVTNSLGLASPPDQVVVKVEPYFLVLPLVSRQAAP